MLVWVLVLVCTVSSMSLDGDKDNFDVEEVEVLIGADSSDVLDSSMTLGADRDLNGADDRMGCEPETITRPLFWVLTRTKMIKRMTMAVGCTQSMCYAPKAKSSWVCPKAGKKDGKKQGVPPAIKITLIQDRSQDGENFQSLIKPSRTRPAAVQDLLEFVQDREECKDNHNSCKSWMEAKECDKNPAYMHKDCMKSCAKCPEPGSTGSGSGSGGSGSGGSGTGGSGSGGSGSGGSGSGGSGGSDPGMDMCKPVIVNRPPVWFYTTTVTSRMQVTKLACTTEPDECQVTSRMVNWEC